MILFQTPDFSYQAALPEILEVLRSAGETHGLPLAQTWVPCILQGKEGYWHSDDNIKNCVSPVDSACYVANSHIQGFHEACSEYHLLKGQGIVGRAFQTNQPCFSPDVSACSKTEYPLSHHARMFGLKAAVAIRLRSISTGLTDFVLEFFLPVNCKDPEEQKKMLTSLSTIIQNVCHTLRVVTDKELQEEEALANNQVGSISKEVPTVDHTQFFGAYSSQVQSGSEASLFHNGKSRGKLVESSEIRSGKHVSNSKDAVTFAANASTSGDCSSLYTNKTGEKRRIKAEKTITLQVLRQHFAGSLKDAAKSLGGISYTPRSFFRFVYSIHKPFQDFRICAMSWYFSVCPTTLKRICRQHGIQRWPSRKIKKVGHSLQKIQRVIDSVQGASGVLQIESFYSNFPELASPDASRTTQFSHSKSADNLKPSSDEPQPECSVLQRPPPAASLSPSSCSQSSNSSQCCSSGEQPNSYSFSIASHQESVERPKEEEEEEEEAVMNGVLKRTRSDANLHLLTSDGPKLLPRSQSHVSFCWPGKEKIIPPPSTGERSQEREAPRIKVSYGEDTIRFRMQRNWRYGDLLREVSRRFGVDENGGGGFHLKYLDDDREWVLLTCDADLEECIDVCRSSSRNHTIRLSLLRDSLSQQLGTSLSIRGHFSF